MSTERATFVLDLQDGISGPAGDAVAELARLKESMGAGMKRLRELNEAMRRLRDGGIERSSTAFQRLRAEIDAQKTSNRVMQEAYLRLGGTFGDSEASSRSATTGFQRLTTSLKAMGGPLGSVGERLERLGKGIASAPLLVGGLALVVVLAAVAAAAVAVGVAAARAAVQLAQYAVTSADARRTEMLRIEGLLTLRDYQRGAAGSAGELMAAIDRVAGASAAGREDVSRYGEQLYRAGLRGGELTDALEAVTDASTVQGQESARRLIGTMRAAHQAGRSVRGLADDVRSRLGGIARRQALGLDVQVRHLQEDFAHLFDGLQLDGFLRGMRQALGVFSQQHAVGRALASILRSIFQPMLDGTGRAGPVMRVFFEGLTIMALRVGIVVLTARNALLRAFGPDMVGHVDAMRVALYAGGAAALVLAAGLGLAVAPLLVVGVAAAALWSSFQRLRESWTSLTGALAKTRPQWITAGTDLVNGLAQGMRTAAQTLVPGVTQLADMLTSTFRTALDIHSPSRVFAELGAQIPAGVAQGVREGSPDASAAASDAVAVPRAPGATSGRAGGIGEVHIHLPEGIGGSARELAEGIRDELVRLLAGVGAETGAAT